MSGIAFDTGFYSSVLQTSLAAGLSVISLDTAARVFAIFYVHGNNEGFVMSQKFVADMRYIQQRFHMKGGEVPDAQLVLRLRQYISELQRYEKNHKPRYPDWADKLIHERYGFHLFG